MNTIEAQNASPRNLTTLERAQIRLKFIKMNEKPEQFLLDNRYLDRVFPTKILTGPVTKLKKLQAEFEELLIKLNGVYTEDQIQQMKQDADDAEECNLHGRQSCDLCLAMKQLAQVLPLPNTP